MKAQSPAPCVAVVTNTAWNLWNFRRHLIRAFLDAGYRVLMLAPDGPERAELLRTGAEFIPLRNLRRMGTNPLRDALLLRELTGIYRREKVTVGLHFTIKAVIYGSLAARLSGAKNISTLTGLGYTFLADRGTNYLVRFLYRMALRGAACVLFHNEDDLGEFVAGGLISPQQAAVVPGSGLPLDLFPPAPYREARAGRFLFIGRLLTDKGIREFVEAARLARERRPELEFHVIGAPDPGNPASVLPETLEGWTSEGIIHYHGRMADVRPALREASLVVLPSYREGCPRVLLEAGATGRAVIGTDVPGVRQVIVDGETGYLVPARDHVGLLDAFLRDYSTAELERMGRAARRRMEEKFSARAVNAVYLAHLCQLSK